MTMFDIDAGKILVVGVVALLVIGPKDLPRVLRTVGQTVGKMRRMATEFQNQFMEAIKEADLADVKKEISAINESAKIDSAFDPASLMRQEITTAVEGPPREIGQSVIDLTGAGEAAAKPEPEKIAGPAHGPGELESVQLGTDPEQDRAPAHEGAAAPGPGQAVGQGDRG
jgi:sec-independent protein translocase protein TatB